MEAVRVFPFRSVLLLLLLPVLVSGAIPAGAAVPRGKLGIGDSVMLGARDELRAAGWRVNARISRQMRDADAAILAFKRNGRLPAKVVLHLGTNGPFVESDCGAAVRAAGPHRHVYLVTSKAPRRYRAPNNTRLHSCARRFATASLIDWFAYSHAHRSWFAADGYHLTAAGQDAYAAYLERFV
jgi:hypothetical protein